jgi:site-specific DNA-methyltransferase (cytosine-N4-specific)
VPEDDADDQVRLLLGDALETLRTLPDGSVDCIVTSPPYYGLRDYGTDGQYGREASPAEYVETMRGVFAQARRVLAKDGTCWINLGDSYTQAKGQYRTHHRSGSIAASDSDYHQKAGGRDCNYVEGLAPKNMLGMPWRVAFALQDDGWILRNDIIWSKPNAMPESATDRLSTRYEHVFLLAKSTKYRFGLDAVREPHAPSTLRRSTTRTAYKAPGQIPNVKSRPSGERGANPGDVWAADARQPETDYRLDRDHSAVNDVGRNPGDLWAINTRPYAEAHFATMPIELAQRCIKAGCRPGGIVLDPFSGSGTTGEAARKLGRKYVGIDLNPAYHDLAVKRFAQGVLDFETEETAA